MGYLIKQSTADQDLLFLMLDEADHVTGKTGLSPTVTISKNGGSFASPSGAVSEVGNGWYKVAKNSTDSNTLGPLLLHATGTGADPCDDRFDVVAFNPQDSVRLGVTALPNAAAEAAGGLVTNGTGSGQVSLSGGRANADVVYWNAAAVATPDTAGYPKITIKSGTGTGELSLNSGVVDAAANVTHSGTAQAGSASSITLEAGASATADTYNRQLVQIVSGTGAGQVRNIADYNGTSKVADITPNWGTNPDNTSVYRVLAGYEPQVNTTGDVHAVNDAGNALATALGVQNVADQIGAPVGLNISNDIASIKSDTSQVYLDTAAIKLKTDNLPASPAATGDIPSAATIADAVCDEALSGHATAGTVGKALSDVLADTAELQGDWANGGRLDLLIDAILDDTGTSGVVVSATSVRTAVGLAAADLDTQLAALPTASENADAVTDELVSEHTTAGSVGAQLASVYAAQIDLSLDDDNSQDEYTVQWFKNGAPVTSGITSPTIQVIKRADGTDLVAQVAMSQIGSTGAYKYDVTSAGSRISEGEAVVVHVQATIDGATRTWRRVLSRDAAVA